MAESIGAVAKTLVFTVFAPGTVAGYIPWRLRGNAPIAVLGVQEWLAIALIAAGVAIYLYTAFWSFAWIGGGTPAPISPTKTLVVRGLHRFVRNPMYLGVAAIIGGQAWLFRSRQTFFYLLFFLAAAHLFVLLYEEPTLHRQFGQQYDYYRKTVPRWMPRVRL